ncbi:TetR/AcrR family transcriptional regulator [Glycomyces tritici]|uniref:TetR family transcriptional regulator n=1 Tax=Glycomyces tritici TaxID=2665176 RepID=A0ABT7YL98_9ACTN|nr:TetR/AcrR family transcriptional regulator [Glycomyces tritici]MDN3239409.1 TetR family transcriptional regulator [Glycomyces tritici]
MTKTQRTDLRQRADALLDATAALLTAGGSRQIRIEEVARCAGVGKGTVYLHWQSRDHLLLAVGAREAAAMTDAVVAAIRADPFEAAPHRYLRRHFLEAMRRPILRLIFSADGAELAAFAGQRPRSGLAATKLITSRDYLTALADHDLLRPGIELSDVDHGLQAVAYGFFAAGPFLPEDPQTALEHRAGQLAEIIRRSFEPDPTPAPDRYGAAAPRVVDAFTRLADEYRRTAYGAAAA